MEAIDRRTSPMRIDVYNDGVVCFRVARLGQAGSSFEKSSAGRALTSPIRIRFANASSTYVCYHINTDKSVACYLWKHASKHRSTCSIRVLRFAWHKPLSSLSSLQTRFACPVARRRKRCPTRAVGTRVCNTNVSLQTFQSCPMSVFSFYCGTLLHNL